MLAYPKAAAYRSQGQPLYDTDLIACTLLGKGFSHAVDTSVEQSRN